MRCTHAEDRLFYLENDLIKLQQYSRRENIEIIGIPDSVQQNNLEKTVIGILQRIGVKISSYHISACHRLQKKRGSRTANVIVQFINRSHAIACFKNKKLLKEQVTEYKLAIVENLCPNNKSIFNYCVKMREEGKIDKLWTYNGTVHFKFKEDPTIQKCFHYDDLYDFFPDDDEEDE